LQNSLKFLKFRFIYKHQGFKNNQNSKTASQKIYHQMLKRNINLSQTIS